MTTIERPGLKAAGPPWARLVPASWSVVPLVAVGQESRVSNAGLVERNLLSLSYGEIVPKDIDKLDGLLPESFETYQIVEPGDVVFRFTDLQNDTRSLRSALVCQRGIITSAYLAFTPSPKVEPRYLAYLMRSYDLNKVFYGMGGGLRQSLKFADVRRVPVLVPPREDQVAIADFLDRETAKIDALIAKQRALIDGLGTRRSVAISQAVDAESLALPGARLRHVVGAVRQGWSPQCNNWPAEGDDWAVLKAGCVNGGVFRPGENKQLPGGLEPRPETVVRKDEVIVSRANSRELVGSAAVVHDAFSRLMLSDKLYALTLREGVNPDFVALALGSRRYRDLIELEATGASSSMQNISQRVILDLPFCPPSRAEQDATVGVLRARVAELDGLASKAERFIELAKERRAALITAAVTGQLDVATGKVA